MQKASIRWWQALFAALLCSLSPASAQQLPSLTLGRDLGLQLGNSVLLVRTLDQEQLFLTSRFGLRVRAEISEASGALEAENTRLLEELTAAEAALTAARPTMPPADFRAAADAFDLRAESIRRTQAEKRARLSAYQEQEELRFFQLAGPVLQRLLLESGAQIVVDARAVILGVPGLDLTREAIAVLDADLGDGAPAPNPLDMR
jgi:Skp family chaperone for outer membrane proteins